MRAHDVAHGLHVKKGPRVHQPKGHIKQCRPKHKAKGDHGRVAHRLIGDGGYDQRKDQLAYGGQHRADQVKGQHLLVILVVGEKAPHIVAGAVLRFRGHVISFQIYIFASQGWASIKPDKAASSGRSWAKLS